jgi:replicative DNA helicase
MSERVPPQDMDNEMAAIGAMLIDVKAVTKAVEIITPADFYRPRHRDIYAGILDLYQRREPVDIVLLGTWLQDRGKLEKCGNTLYLQECMQTCTTSRAVEYYCKIVKGKAIQRALIQAADAIIEESYEHNGDIANLTASAEQKVLSIGQNCSTSGGPERLSAYLKRVYDKQEDSIAAGKQKGLKFGYRGIDRMVRYLLPGNLVIIGARPKMGKTSLALALAKNLSHPLGENKYGLVFSMEMEGEELSLRMLLSEMTYGEGELDDVEFCANNPEVMTQMSSAVDKVWDLNIDLDDRPGYTVAEIDRIVRRMTREHGKPDYIMVDYLQMAGVAKTSGNRNTDVGGIAYDLKALAKNHKTVVFTLSQLTRSVEAERPYRPRAIHFLESGKIEASADLLTYLYWPYKYGEEEMAKHGLTAGTWHDNLVEFGIIMARRGTNGNQRCYLMHNPGHYSYRDLTADERGEIRRIQEGMKI